MKIRQWFKRIRDRRELLEAQEAIIADNWKQIYANGQRLRNAELRKLTDDIAINPKPPAIASNEEIEADMRRRVEEFRNNPEVREQILENVAKTNALFNSFDPSNGGRWRV